MLAEHLPPSTTVHTLASRRSVAWRPRSGADAGNAGLETFEFSKVQFCLMSAAPPSRRSGHRASPARAAS